MPTCRRCADPFTRLTLAQRHCPPCDRELAAIERRGTTGLPAGMPEWRRRGLAKDMTGVRT